MWNVFGTPETLAHKDAVLREHCEEVGRDPDTIERTVGCKITIRRTAEEAERVRRGLLEHNRTPLERVAARRDARVLRHKVGLRPVRPAVRLERVGRVVGLASARRCRRDLELGRGRGGRLPRGGGLAVATLILLRHAKSDWSGGGADIDRPLGEWPTPTVKKGAGWRPTSPTSTWRSCPRPTGPAARVRRVHLGAGDRRPPRWPAAEGRPRA